MSEQKRCEACDDAGERLPDCTTYGVDCACNEGYQPCSDCTPDDESTERCPDCGGLRDEPGIVRTGPSCTPEGCDCEWETCEHPFHSPRSESTDRIAMPGYVGGGSGPITAPHPPDAAEGEERVFICPLHGVQNKGVCPDPEHGDLAPWITEYVPLSRATAAEEERDGWKSLYREKCEAHAGEYQAFESRAIRAESQLAHYKAEVEQLRDAAHKADVTCRELAWWTKPTAPPDELAQPARAALRELRLILATSDHKEDERG